MGRILAAIMFLAGAASASAQTVGKSSVQANEKKGFGSIVTTMASAAKCVTCTGYRRCVSESQCTDVKIFGRRLRAITWNFKELEEKEESSETVAYDAELGLSGYVDPFSGKYDVGASFTVSRSFGWNQTLLGYGAVIWAGPAPVYIFVEAEASVGFTFTGAAFAHAADTGAEVGLEGACSFGGSVGGEVGGGVGIPFAYIAIVAEVTFIEGTLDLDALVSSAGAAIDCSYEITAARIRIFVRASVGWGWFRKRYEHTLVEVAVLSHKAPILSTTLY